MSDSVHIHTRRSALLLHAMARVDREWVLEQLPLEQRTALSSLVNELRDLGMPADKQLLNEAMLASALPSPLTGGSLYPANVGADGNHDEPLALLRLKTELMHATPEAMVDVLALEPAGLIARLLRCSSWPWQAKFMDGLHLVKRRQVEQFLADQVSFEADTHLLERSASLDEALLRAVYSRLRLQAALPQEESPVTPKAGLTFRWRRVGAFFFRKRVNAYVK